MKSFISPLINHELSQINLPENLDMIPNITLMYKTTELIYLETRGQVPHETSNIFVCSR